MINKVEIVAPAGNMAALKAAVLAGANAVYLGGEKFSARAKARNFSLEELKNAIEFAHLRKVKIYVTINTLLADSEISEALDFTRELYHLGVDGIIVQDMGFGSLCRQTFPSLSLHASTQMTIHNVAGAKLLEKLGFSTVVLARETPLEEIAKIKKQTNIKLEVFIHGALCVCYSGQCLMSSMIGGRSGNRGACAQPCRKSYEILDMDKNKIGHRKFYLSPKDLNTLHTVKDIIAAGANSLKIEGRMKRPEYVYQIVSTYRKAIEEELKKKDFMDVKQIFNRGFTKGINNGDFGRNFIADDRPDNQGVQIGKVLENNDGKAYVEFFEEIFQNDGLEFKGTSGNWGMKMTKNFKKGISYLDLPPFIVKSSPIYRTRSALLESEIDQALADEKYYRPLTIKTEVRVGEYPKLLLESGKYKTVIVGDHKVEIAKKQMNIEQMLKENLTKIKDTVFQLENLQLSFDPRAFMKRSEINQLRRRGIKQLEELILSREKPQEITLLRNFPKTDIPDSKFIVELKDPKDLSLLKLEDIDELVIQWKDRKKVSLNSISMKTQISLKLENILSTDDMNNIKEELMDYPEITGLWFNNWGQVDNFKNFKGRKIGDIGLNLFNDLDLKVLQEYGFQAATLSPELTMEQIVKMNRKKILPLQAITYGCIPVMTMEHCPFAIIKDCKSKDQCSHCNYKNYYIRDEKNVDFEVRRDHGLTKIYNSYPIYLEKEVEVLKENKISLIIFSDPWVNKVLDQYKNNKKQVELKKTLVNHYGNFTRGHFSRGIL